jgi:hypothetical protein
MAKIARGVDILLGVCAVMSIGIALALVTHLSWVVTTIIAMLLVAFIIGSQLILFLIVYKMIALWKKHQDRRGLSFDSFTCLLPPIIKGYIRSLVCEMALVSLLAVFHVPIGDILQFITLSFTAICILTTLLTSGYQTWRKGNDIPLVLCIAFTVQLGLLLLVKLL